MQVTTGKRYVSDGAATGKWQMAAGSIRYCRYKKLCFSAQLTGFRNRYGLDIGGQKFLQTWQVLRVDAGEHLEDAGCVMGDKGFYERNGQEIGFVLSVGAGDQVRLDMAQAAAQQLQQVGINCTVEVPSKVDWEGQMAYLIGWGSPFDADDHTYKVFGTGKGANYSGYSNALVDQYLSEARQSNDPVVRKEAYAKFQTALAEDPAYAFIRYVDASYVASSALKGISPDTVLGHHGVGIFWNVTEWSIEK